MLFFILAFFGTCVLIVFFCIGVIILGEYLAGKFKGSNGSVFSVEGNRIKSGHAFLTEIFE